MGVATLILFLRKKRKNQKKKKKGKENGRKNPEKNLQKNLKKNFAASEYGLAVDLAIFGFAFLLEKASRMIGREKERESVSQDGRFAFLCFQTLKSLIN